MHGSAPQYNVRLAERLGIGSLFRSADALGDRIQSRLYGQLLSSPVAALMGSVCSLMVLVTASVRSPSTIFAVFIALEIVIAASRMLEWRLRKSRGASEGPTDVSVSAILSILWCGLQGAIAFTIMSGSDPVMQVLAATLIMAMLGPICARNYAAPRFATLLLLLCDLPFVAGAVLSPEPLLSIILLLTPPFLFGARQIISTFHNTLTQSLRAEEENLRLALHDSLTGILNRQGMDERLGRMVAKPGHTMAIVSVDLDGFKEINDEYGHGAGDTVLIEVARRIASQTGEDGTVARMGGDEFMVIVRNCGVDEVRRLGERLVAAISEQEIAIARDLTVGVGASAGFACLPEDALTTHELRIRADRALYDAKDAGKRNCKRYSKPDLTIDELNGTLKQVYS